MNSREEYDALFDTLKIPKSIMDTDFVFNQVRDQYIPVRRTDTPESHLASRILAAARVTRSKDPLVIETDGTISYFRYILETHLRSNSRMFATRLFTTLNAVAFTKYENADCKGAIELVRRCPGGLTAKFQPEAFTNIFTDIRSTRKMIELTKSRQNVLVCEVRVRRGTACLQGIRSAGAAGLVVEFEKNGCWTIKNAGVRLLTIVNMRPVYVGNAAFNLDDIVKRISDKFSGAPDFNEENLKQVIAKCKKQSHGTMVVITAAAADESLRLKEHSTRVEPFNFWELSDENVIDITAIDGAVMVDFSGVCYAVGVIVDGVVSEGVGNRGRGARHNSAAKYASTKADLLTAVICISEDGPATPFGL